MDAIVKPIENALAPIFKELPALPPNVKKALVKYWPIIALVLGVLQLVAVLSLWNLGHAATNVANQIYMAAGASPIAPALSAFYYLGLGSLLIDGLLLLMAYAPLKARLKRGWDLLFLATLVNLLYGALLLFDGYYGGFMHLISALVGSAIAWYFLFQIRESYVGSASSKSQK